MSGADSQPASTSNGGGVAATSAVSSSSEQKNPTTTTTQRNDINGAFAVKVKSEYVLSERPSCLAPPSVEPPRSENGQGGGDDGSNNKDDRNNNNNNNNGNKKANKKNRRGQNKKRPRDTKIAYGDKACLAVVRGEPCPFQNSERGCRYNHDLKEMLADRPKDIFEGEGGAEWLKEEGCPFWRMKG